MSHHLGSCQCSRQDNQVAAQGSNHRKAWFDSQKNPCHFLSELILPHLACLLRWVLRVEKAATDSRKCKRKQALFVLSSSLHELASPRTLHCLSYCPTEQCTYPSAALSFPLASTLATQQRMWRRKAVGSTLRVGSKWQKKPALMSCKSSYRVQYETTGVWWSISQESLHM